MRLFPLPIYSLIPVRVIIASEISSSSTESASETIAERRDATVDRLWTAFHHLSSFYNHNFPQNPLI